MRNEGLVTTRSRLEQAFNMRSVTLITPCQGAWKWTNSVIGRTSRHEMQRDYVSLRAAYLVSSIRFVYTTNMEQFNAKETADAMKFCEIYRTLRDALNPEWCKAAAQEIFSGSAIIANLREGFDIHEETYANVGPNADVCPAVMRHYIEKALGRDVDAALKLYMLIPKRLAKVSRRTVVKIAIRFHGGEGVSSDSHRSLQTLAKQCR